MKVDELFLTNGWELVSYHDQEAFCFCVPDGAFFLATDTEGMTPPKDINRIFVGLYHVDGEPASDPSVMTWESIFDMIESYIERYDLQSSDDVHSLYSPSQLPRIIRCPGSTQLHKGGKSSSYAQEGTKCHAIVAAHLLRRSYELNPLVLSVFPKEDRQELGYAIQDCLDFSFGLISQYGKDAYVFIETRVGLGGFAAELQCDALEEVSGTGDLIIKVPKQHVIHVVDWKFGKGVEVYPDSEQIYAYGLGAIKTPAAIKNFKEVILHVGQPRLYSGDHFKKLSKQPKELYDWASSDLVGALNKVDIYPPILNPTEKGCMWCSIKATCVARFNKAQETAEEIFKVFAELPYIKQPEELQSFLVKAREYTSYVKDIEKFIMNSLRAGVEIPGLKLVEGRSIRRWADAKAFVMWANEHVPDAEIFEEPKLVSPSIAEKLVKRKIAKTDEFQALIYKPPGKPTMVGAADPREAINFKTASDIFAEFADDDDDENLEEEKA